MAFSWINSKAASMILISFSGDTPLFLRNFETVGGDSFVFSLRAFVYAEQAFPRDFLIRVICFDE